MVSCTYTVAFQGVAARPVEVQCAVSSGLPSFSIVGLPDKAVSEAKERVRAAINSMAMALPSKKITVNLSPADLPKAGSHFDLPIALAVLAAMDVLPVDEMARTVALGELSLDGKLVAVNGSLPAALSASENDWDLVCPAQCGPEAAWVADTRVTAANTLLELFNHFTGRNPLPPAKPGEVSLARSQKCLSDVKGQETAKRVLEIAAAGRHHVIMVGEPGSGKSMMAARLPDLLPPQSAAEALDTSLIHSVAGLLGAGGISRTRPFRDPHHTASMAAIVGGGRNAGPGEISLAHNGVLFLDEFPEFGKQVLETLRQPLETAEVMVARANAHVRYPCNFMLVAAANPCKCGYFADPNRACSRAPQCGINYMGRISGPLMDRFDLRIDTPSVCHSDLTHAPNGEPSSVIAHRVQAAWEIQHARYNNAQKVTLNSDIEGKLLETVATPDAEGAALLSLAADKFRLTARGYHRVLRVARTIADLDASHTVRKPHVAEALSYRLNPPMSACG